MKLALKLRSQLTLSLPAFSSCLHSELLRQRFEICSHQAWECRFYCSHSSSRHLQPVNFVRKSYHGLSASLLGNNNSYGSRTCLTISLPLSETLYLIIFLPPQGSSILVISPLSTISSIMTLCFTLFSPQ